MKYLCLGYFEPAKFDALPKGGADALMDECRPHMKEMYKTNQVLVDAGLDTAIKRIQRVNGKVIATDGPFAETKEMLGSALLLDATDMEDAVRVASLHPTTRIHAGEQLGWRMEIRPIHYFHAGANLQETTPCGS